MRAQFLLCLVKRQKLSPHALRTFSNRLKIFIGWPLFHIQTHRHGDVAVFFAIYMFAFLCHRRLLCDVVAVKVQLYKMSKSRSMTAEEYVKVRICLSS